MRLTYWSIKEYELPKVYEDLKKFLEDPSSYGDGGSAEILLVNFYPGHSASYDESHFVLRECLGINGIREDIYARVCQLLRKWYNDPALSQERDRIQKQFYLECLQ